MGIRRSRLVFVLCASSTNSRRGADRTRCHCSESNSPLRQPVSSAASTRARKCGSHAANNRSPSSGSSRRVRRPSRDNYDHRFRPAFERGSVEVFHTDCPVEARSEQAQITIRRRQAKFATSGTELLNCGRRDVGYIPFSEWAHESIWERQHNAPNAAQLGQQVPAGSDSTFRR